MFVEQPPLLYRLLFPEAIWRLKHADCRSAYLTFDDGPVPEVTPWVLDILRKYDIKATFFMVGDNVRRYPHLLQRVLDEGHSVGNHTMHHMQAIKESYRSYLRDVAEARQLIPSVLFRPPHGLMWRRQAKAMRARYNVVMYDVVTRDYDRSLSPERVFGNVRRYTRDGSIIVFHDSVKAWPNLQHALPQAIEWLLQQGYTLRPLDMK